MRRSKRTLEPTLPVKQQLELLSSPFHWSRSDFLNCPEVVDPTPFVMCRRKGELPAGLGFDVAMAAQVNATWEARRLIQLSPYFAWREARRKTGIGRNLGEHPPVISGLWVATSEGICEERLCPYPELDAWIPDWEPQPPLLANAEKYKCDLTDLLSADDPAMACVTWLGTTGTVLIGHPGTVLWEHTGKAVRYDHYSTREHASLCVIGYVRYSEVGFDFLVAGDQGPEKGRHGFLTLPGNVMAQLLRDTRCIVAGVRLRGAQPDRRVWDQRRFSAAPAMSSV